MKGGTVCKRTHGAQAKTIAKAEQRATIAQAQQTIAAMIVSYGGEVTVDPLESLMRMVQTAAWAERAYATVIERDLGAVEDEGPDVEGGRPERHGILVSAPVRSVNGVTAIQLDAHPYIKLWNEERDRLAKMSKLALDAGVAEKMVKVQVAQVEITAAALDAEMTDAGLSQETRFAILQGMARRLRGGDAAG